MRHKHTHTHTQTHPHTKTKTNRRTHTDTSSRIEPWYTEFPVGKQCTWKITILLNRSPCCERYWSSCEVGILHLSSIAALPQECNVSRLCIRMFVYSRSTDVGPGGGTHTHTRQPFACQPAIGCHSRDRSYCSILCMLLDHWAAIPPHPTTGVYTGFVCMIENLLLWEIRECVR